METVVFQIIVIYHFPDLVKCFREAGAVAGLSTCKPVLALFNACKADKSVITSFQPPPFKMYPRPDPDAPKATLTRSGG